MDIKISYFDSNVWLPVVSLGTRVTRALVKPYQQVAVERLMAIFSSAKIKGRRATSRGSAPVGALYIVGGCTSQFAAVYSNLSWKYLLS